jgi:hypothetical protein
MVTAPGGCKVVPGSNPCPAHYEGPYAPAMKKSFSGFQRLQEKCDIVWMKEKINNKMSGIAPPNFFLSSEECGSILSIVKIRYASLLLNFLLLSLGQSLGKKIRQSTLKKLSDIFRGL